LMNRRKSEIILEVLTTSSLFTSVSILMESKKN
jgi:hypothetical protein